MFDPVVLFQLGPLTVTAYGVCLAVAIAVSLLALRPRAKRMGMPEGTVLRFGLTAIPLAVVGARLFYCAVRAPRLFPEYDAGFLLRIWEGGFGIAGAFGGCALAAYITARRTGQPVGRMMDCVVPGCALMLALARFSEGFAGTGYGDYLENEALWFFPLAVKNIYGEYYVALFMLEGLVALALAAALLRMEKRGTADRPGDLTLLFLLLYGATQIVLESLRRDSFLRWGFVRVNQLFGVALLALVTAVSSARAWRAGASRTRLALEWSAALLCVGVGVGMEFAFEKSRIPNLIAYGILIAAMAVIAGLAFAQMRRARRLEGSAAPR